MTSCAPTAAPGGASARRWRSTVALLAIAAGVAPGAALGAGLDARLPAARAVPAPCDRARPSGRVRALLVGIDTYRETDSAGRPWFTPLAGSANDAHLLAEAIKRRAGADPRDVRLLLEGDASADGFFAALNELVEATGCGDFVLLHFSGHTWRGALALADASIRNGSGLVFEGDLRRAVTALRNRGAFVLVHLDANTPEPLQLDVRRGATWRAAGDRADGGLELAVDAGGLAAFFAGPLAFEQKVVVARPEGGQETRVYGLFTFGLAAALGSGPLPTVRELATRIRAGLAARGRGGLAPSPSFESTEPDRPAFATGLAAATAAPAPRAAPVVGARIEILEPKRTRGIVLSSSPTLRVAGRVVPPDAIAAVVVGGTQARLLGGGRFEADLSLRPGSRTVYAVAVFSDHSTATESLELQGGTEPAAPARAGRAYALVVGNAEYRHMARLRTPARDADAVATLLRERFGFATALELDDGRSLPLVLKEAGRRELFAALSQLRRRLGEDDSLLVFYAGHGDRPERAAQAYWLPVDAEPDDHANWISADDIASEVSLMNARHVLIVADSCFSGGLLRGATPTAPSGRDERARYLAEVSRRRSRHLMSSGANEPVLDDDGGGHSVFANAFLRGLEGMPERVFSAQQLFGARIQEQVAGKARQTPQYGPIVRSGHDGGDFVFHRTQ